MTMAPERAESIDGRISLSLDGTWEIVFDPANVGHAEGWDRADTFPASNARPIPVPSCWELTEKDYEGVAVYRHRFVVPADWDGKVVRLQFDAVNFRAEVWVNDSALGVHEGGFTPFDFRVDDVLAFGEENTLIVRVAGPILLQDKSADGVGRLETPQWRGAITGGIWQPVRLLATGDTLVQDLVVEPHVPTAEAACRLELCRTVGEAAEAIVRIAISDAVGSAPPIAQQSRALTLQPGRTRQALTVPIPDMVCWSPDNPHLYRLDVRVEVDGGVSDTRSIRFGMREFTIRDKQFVLNGEPLFLKATFYEGLYPVGLAYPDSREMAAREIRLAKEAGFNMIRPWRKPPPPMWLDLCDEMGVLTVGSLAIECMDFPVETTRLPGWVENEVRESIRRDRNRTCVVQWELFNELKRPVLKRLLHPMSMLAREMDPTRLILDESGGWAQGARMYLPCERVPIRFNDIHHYPGAHINDNSYEKLLLTAVVSHEEMRERGLTGRLPGDNVAPGRMTFISELGYGSLPDLVDNNERFAALGSPLAPTTIYHRRLAEEHRQALAESGLDSVFPDLRAFCLDQQLRHGTANRRMIEAARCNPNVAGYCVHALTAGNWIMGAGLLDLFRNPKTYAYQGTKAACQPQVLSIRTRPRNVYADRGTSIQVMAVNEIGTIEGTVAIAVTGPDGESLASADVSVTLRAGVTTVWDERVTTAALRGTYTVKATLSESHGRVLADNTYTFDVFQADQLQPPECRVAVLDPAGSLTPFLESVGVAVEPFGSAITPDLPVLVAQTRAQSPAVRESFEAVKEFVVSGGSAIYLGGGGPRIAWGEAAPVSDLLPVSGRQKIAAVTWNGVSHIVTDHPVFAGLPTSCSMGPIYENVQAANTLIGIEGELAAGAIGFDWFPNYDRMERHYYGPGDTWWGADVVVAPAGDGRCILSQLDLVRHLGQDPAADRILFNLIEVASDR